MRKFAIMVAGVASLGIAGAANAQYPSQYGYQTQYGSGYSGGSDWNYRRGTYAMFSQQYRHAIEGTTRPERRQHIAPAGRDLLP